jgi:hypothetical protein
MNGSGKLREMGTAGAAARRGRGRGVGVGPGAVATAVGEGAAAARVSEESERVRKKALIVWYVRVLCRVPVIRHSVKFFLILKYALSSARSLALGKSLLCRVSTS